MLPARSIPIAKGNVNLFYILVFLYFITLSADLLNIQLYLYKVKLNHLFSLGLLLCLGSRILTISKAILTPFLLILGSLIISMLFSVHKGRCLGYIGVYLFDFIVYFLVPYNLINKFDREKILRIYFVSFQVIGCYALFQLIISFFGVKDPFAVQSIGSLTRPNGLSYEPSYYALYMCFGVMFCNALHILGSKQKLLFNNVLLLVSTSTGGFFSYFIFFFVALFFKNTKQRLLSLYASFVGFFLLITLCFPQIVKNYFLKLFFYGFAFESFSERWYGITNAVKVFLANPLFGVGLGGVGPYLFLENQGYSATKLQEMERYDPTNVATEILASLGIFGFLCFSILAISFFSLFRKIKPQNQTATALFIALITSLIVLQFNQGLFRSYIWVTGGITFGYLSSLQHSK